MVRVLVVDDEPAVGRALSRVLAAHGFEVRTCTSGRDALDCLREWPASSVLSDFQMPEMNGVQLLAQVKQAWPRTRRVLVSALADTLHPVALEPCAPCTVVAKPWREEELLLILRSEEP